MTVNRLLVVLGDQLEHRYPSHAGLDPACDALFMAEVGAESTHVASHVQRTVMFLSAMRHYAAERKADGWRVHYRKLGDPDNQGDLHSEIVRACARLSPRQLIAYLPGEWRVLEVVTSAAACADVPLEVLGDPHFLCDRATFDKWAAGRTGALLGASKG
ncbi:MAG: cryptochrome/photolyase family protein [Anaerolineae bacterium]|jgi:deoxyribodipyrimidine photolyase-related protein